MSGEAAGVAAALAVRETHGDAHDLPAESVRHHLTKMGNLLDPQLAQPAPELAAAG
jgi:hypothetical protein